MTDVEITARAVPSAFSTAWYRRILGDRFVVLLAAAGATFLSFMLIALVVSPRFSSILFWTFVNAETAYPLWQQFYGLRPLPDYLSLILGTSTVYLLVFWFVIFQGENPLLDGLLAKRRFVRPDRYPRLHTWIIEWRRLGLFVAGLIPNAWPLGFLVLRLHPTKGGLSIVILGNATKLTLTALAYATVSGWMSIGVMVLVFLAFLFPSRLIERLLPNGNR